MIVAGNTQKHANRLMYRLQQLFKLIHNHIVEERAEYLKLDNGTEYFAFPSNPSSYRGIEKVKAIFVDEGAHFDFVDDYIVYDALEPITLASKPDLFIISTPNGKRGFFYELYVQAVAGNNKFKPRFWNYEKAMGWLYSQADIDEKKRDLTIDFEQEYNGQFTTTRHSIFGEIFKTEEYEAVEF